MNEILWAPKALRQLRKLDRPDAVQVRHAASVELADLSKARHVKALVGHEFAYRLRVGAYRVLFDVIEGQPRIVRIEEVRKRDERTY